MKTAHASSRELKQIVADEIRSRLEDGVPYVTAMSVEPWIAGLHDEGVIDDAQATAARRFSYKGHNHHLYDIPHTKLSRLFRMALSELDVPQGRAWLSREHRTKDRDVLESVDAYHTDVEKAMNAVLACFSFDERRGLWVSVKNPYLE